MMAEVQSVVDVSRDDAGQQIAVVFDATNDVVRLESKELRISGFGAGIDFVPRDRR